MKLSKLIVVLMILSIVFCFAKAPEKTLKFDSYPNMSSKHVIKRGNQFHNLGVRTDAKGEKVVVDTIWNFFPLESPEGYTSVLADAQAPEEIDTVIKRFTLIADGYVKKVFMQNMTAGNASFMFWGPCYWPSNDGTGRFVNLPENGFEGDDGTVVPGAQPYLPYNASLACDAQEPADQFNGLGDWEPVWNVLDVDAAYPGGMNPLLTGDSTELWVGYATDGVDGPSIWQDDEYQICDWWWDIYSFSTLKAIDPEPANYYAVTNGQDDPYNALNHVMMIEVEYPKAPPFIENVPELSNMYDTEAEITAEIFEMEGEDFTATLRYYFEQNGVETEDVEVEMTLVEGDLYSGTITGASAGDTVRYAVIAEDVTEESNSVGWFSYVVKTPPATANIMVIDAGNGSSDSLFALAMDDLGLDYATWNTNDEGGLHRSVVDHPGLDLIFVTGWGTMVVPTTDQEDLYGIADFLEAGGSLVLSDQDWFFAWGLDESGTFEAGDFAYDYFGVGDFVNDPGDGETGYADLEFYGVAGDALTGSFASPIAYGPLVYEGLGWENWGDYVSPNTEADSRLIFTGKDNGEGMGVANSGDYKTAYLSFAPEAIASADFAEFTTLIENLTTNLAVLYGDVTGDGNINVADIIKVVNFILGVMEPSDYESVASDISGDGAIDVNDVIQILNIILGKQDFIPASTASVSIQGNQVNLNSNGDIGGIQFTLKSVGDIELTAGPGVELSYQQNGSFTKVVAYTKGLSLPTNVPVVTLSQPAELSGVIVADRGGKKVKVVSAIASDFSLNQNYPNPFNPTTNISYNLSANIQVRISIYNLLGQEIKTLVNASQKAGLHTIQWNGKDVNGLEVPAGLYFYKMEAGKFNDMKKMFFIK